MPGEKHDREDIWQFIWRGEHHNVADGTEMLILLCNLLRIEHPDRFEQLAEEFPAKRKRWFVRGREGLARGHRFDGSDTWLDTNMSTERKRKFAHQLLQFFGHGVEEIDFRSTKTKKP